MCRDQNTNMTAPRRGRRTIAKRTQISPEYLPNLTNLPWAPHETPLGNLEFPAHSVEFRANFHM
jgi:hypothetical protein